MFNVDNMIKYEEGELGEQETIDMFQDIYDKKLYLTLQGSYGRMLRALIEEGLIDRGEHET